MTVSRLVALSFPYEGASLHVLATRTNACQHCMP